MKRLWMIPLSIGLGITLSAIGAGDDWLLILLGASGYVLAAWGEPPFQRLSYLLGSLFVLVCLFLLIPVSPIAPEFRGNRIVSMHQWLGGGVGIVVAATIHLSFFRKFHRGPRRFGP